MELPTRKGFCGVSGEGSRGGMGKASKIFKSESRLALYLLGAICAALGALIVGG
jgi:hypothetical protein